MLGLVLAVSMAAAPGPLRVAAPGLGSLNLDAKATTYYSDFIAHRLSEQPNLRVTSASEIGALIGLEKQRQLLGCSEQNQSCAVEIAQALGVDAILTGSIGRFDSTYQVDVRLISSSDGALLASDSGRVEGETALLERLTAAARNLSVRWAERTGREVPAVTGASSPGTGGARSWAWLPAAAGAVALGAGGYFTWDAGRKYDSLVRGEPADVTAAKDVQRQGEESQLRARVLVGAGAALLAAGGAMYLLGGGTEGTVAWVPFAGGGAVVWSGRWP